MNLHIICATFKEQCLYMYLFVNFCTDLWFLYAKKFIKKKKKSAKLVSNLMYSQKFAALQLYKYKY